MIKVLIGCFGVGVGRVFFCAVLPMFLLYYLVFRSRKCLEKILLMSGLVFLGFLDWLSGAFRGDFSGPEMAHFCGPKTACEKFSLSLFFFGVLFCYAVVSGRFWGKSSASRSGDVLDWFWVCVSIWILYQIQGVLSAVFGFRRCFFALSFLPPSLPSSSSSSSSGGMA